MNNPFLYISVYIATSILLYFTFSHIGAPSEPNRNSVASHFSLDSLLSNDAAAAIKLLLVIPIAGGFAAVASQFPGLIIYLNHKLFDGKPLEIGPLHIDVSAFLQSGLAAQFSAIVFIILSIYFFNPLMTGWLANYRDAVIAKAKLYDRIDKIALHYARDALKSRKALDIERELEDIFGRCVVTQKLLEIGDESHILGYKFIWYSRDGIQKYGYIVGLGKLLTRIGIMFREKNVWFPRAKDVLTCFIICILLITIYDYAIPTQSRLFTQAGFSWPESDNSGLIFQSVWGFTTIVIPTVLGFSVYFYKLKYEKKSLNLESLWLELLEVSSIVFLLALFLNYLYMTSNVISSLAGCLIQKDQIGNACDSSAATWSLSEPRRHIQNFFTAGTCVIIMICWYATRSMRLQANLRRALVATSIPLSCALWSMIERSIYETTIKWQNLCPTHDHEILSQIVAANTNCEVYYGRGYYVHNFIFGFFMGLLILMTLWLFRAFANHAYKRTMIDDDGDTFVGPDVLPWHPKHSISFDEE